MLLEPRLVPIVVVEEVLSLPGRQVVSMGVCEEVTADGDRGCGYVCGGCGCVGVGGMGGGVCGGVTVGIAVGVWM